MMIIQDGLISYSCTCTLFHLSYSNYLKIVNIFFSEIGIFVTKKKIKLTNILRHKLGENAILYSFDIPINFIVQNVSQSLIIISCTHLSQDK